MDYLVISLIIFIVLLVIMFATVNVQYVGKGANNQLSQVPVDMLNERNPSGIRKGFNASSINTKSGTGATTSGSNSVGKNNPSAPKYGLFNLPEKDEYMSPELRAQIDNLRTQYYYDNCQFKLLSSAASPIK